MKQRIGSYKEVLDWLYDGVYFTDLERRVLYWNKSAQRLSGYDTEEIVGAFCSETLIHTDAHGARLCGENCPLKACMEDGKPREAEAFLHHREGHRIPVKVRVSPVFDESGEIIGGVQIFSNNSEKMATLALINNLQKEVSLDHLTGLPNRRFLEGVIRSRMDEMARFGSQVGIIFIDIDHFKSINDRYGHEWGDVALKMVARTLSGVSRSFDVVGRWGGEEFVAMVVNGGEETLPDIAERFRAMIEASTLAAPTGESLHLTVSLGATVARSDDSLESVVARADELMYRSKMAGRNLVTTDCAKAADQAVAEAIYPV